MNLEQLIAEVLHELPFAFAVLSLTIYSSFVFWYERWRYNYIAALFVCYAVRLIVNSQSPAIPAPLNGPDDVEGDSSNVKTPPSIHQTVDYYWSEAVRNYQQYQGRTFHDEEILIDNVSDADYLRTDIRLRLEEFAREQAQADLQAEFISRNLTRIRPGTSSQERERASDSGKGKDRAGKKDR